MTTLIDWNNFNSSLLIEVTRPEGVFTSSAVAINKNTLLTAAHCLEGEILKVRVSLDSSYNPNGNFYEVESYDLHPDYDSGKSNYRFDLAKIKLKNDLPSDMKIYPIIKNDNKLSGTLIRLGFGARDEQNCRTLINPEFKDLRKYDNVLELNDKFSYSGDSGGPVFLQNKGQMYLVAIHSTLSYGPQGRFSYNPLLSSHREWISA